MIDGIMQRAEILIQQRRYPEAEELLRGILNTNPQNIHVLTLLAEVKLIQNNVNEAESLVKNAIVISPDYPYLFCLYSRIKIERDLFDEAEESIRHAVAMDPENADYFAFWASIKLRRKNYSEALELANKALELGPENILGLNIRSTALLKLDKKEESYKTIEGALRENPNSAYTHSNYGWNLLEKGDHKKALMHFREALKNDPGFDYAKAGMGEALKASNIFYRIFLKYAFWIGNLTAKYQWAVIIGFYVVYTAIKSLANNNEALQPFLIPVIVLMSAIAFSTWVIKPISNLFLRLNPYGKYLLDKREMQSSNIVGISFIIFLTGAALYFVLSDQRFLSIAIFGFAMMVPYSVMFSPAKHKYSLVIYSAAMTLIGIIAILLTFKTGKLENNMSFLFLIGFIAFQWIANFLVIRESNV